MENKVKKLLTWRQILSLPCSPKEHSCKTCGKVFSLKASLKRHMKTHAASKTSRDETQGKIPENIAAEADVPSLPVKAEEYPCKTCEKVFSQKSVLTRHTKIHTGFRQKGHECEICGREFPTMTLVTMHMSGHTGIKEYTCHICGKMMAHKSSLKPHMDIHAGLKNFICNVCGKGFVQRSSLTCHMNVHNEKLECEICGKEFVSKRYLQSHLAHVHFGVKNHKCGVCHKVFSRNTSLKAHEKLHARTKCDGDGVVSEDGFSQKDYFETCSDTEAGGKKFKCRLCGKGFTLKSNLIHHMELHASDKKHKCHVCEKEFFAKRYLKRHLVVHSGVKNHRCGVCGQTFSRKSSMKRHERLHTGSKNHECDICGTKFIQRSSLKSHPCYKDPIWLKSFYQRLETTTPLEKDSPHLTQDAQVENSGLGGNVG